MAIKNFVKDGSYTRISRITISKENKSVEFEIKVYDSEGGALILSPIYFSSVRESEILKYEQINIKLPVAPEYPESCKVCEAKVPMWTEKSTKAEQTEYNKIKSEYEADLKKHKSDSESAIAGVKEKSETENEFDMFFSDEQIYDKSNITACSYRFLKSRPGFEGVADA